MTGIFTSCWLSSLRSIWCCSSYFAVLRADRRGGRLSLSFPSVCWYLSACWTSDSSKNKMSSSCFHLYQRLISSIIKLHFTCAVWGSNSNYLRVTLHSSPAWKAQCFPRQRVVVWEMKLPDLLFIVLILCCVYCWLIYNEINKYGLEHIQIISQSSVYVYLM